MYPEFDSLDRLTLRHFHEFLSISRLSRRFEMPFRNQGNQFTDEAYLRSLVPLYTLQ